MSTSVPTWFVMNPTSRSRRIGISGFWTAPRRASAVITTIVSSVVGELPRHDRALADAALRRAAAAVEAAASRSARPVSERPWSSARSDVIGPLVGGLLDQGPHGGRVRRDALVGGAGHRRRP